MLMTLLSVETTQMVSNDSKLIILKNFKQKTWVHLYGYFLGIEFTQSSSGIVINQRKYALYILSEACMLNWSPIDTSMDPNARLLLYQGESLKDPGRYLHLVGRRNYLIVTIPDITFVVSIMIQFQNAGCDSNWDAI